MPIIPVARRSRKHWLLIFRQDGHPSRLRGRLACIQLAAASAEEEEEEAITTPKMVDSQNPPLVVSVLLVPLPAAPDTVVVKQVPRTSTPPPRVSSPRPGNMMRAAKK